MSSALPAAVTSTEARACRTPPTSLQSTVTEHTSCQPAPSSQLQRTIPIAANVFASQLYDIDGDTYSDLIIGRASGDPGASATGGMVKVFSGLNTASLTNLEAFPGWTSGVRVGAVDADQDGKLDVVAAHGPGDGELRIFTAAGEQLASASPFGANFNHGLFVAGDAQPAGGIGTLDADTAVLTVTVDVDAIEADSTQITFTFHQSAGLNSTGWLIYSVGGTAEGNGYDYTGCGGGYLFIGNGEGNATATATLIDGRRSYVHQALGRIERRRGRSVHRPRSFWPHCRPTLDDERRHDKGPLQIRLRPRFESALEGEPGRFDEERTVRV